MKIKLSEYKIIILCGGRGKRLGKITKKIPKPLVKVGGLSIIEHKLNFYKKQGFKNFAFCIGYKSNLLKKFLKKKCKNATFFEEGVNVGILKRIYLARKIINKPTIISYGDTLAKINFTDLLLKHNKSKAVLSIVVAPIRHPFGLVSWNSKSKATKFEEKPILSHFIGYAIIESKIFDYLNNKIIGLENGKGMVKAIQTLIPKRLVNVYKFDGLQLTVNSPNELKEARTKIGKYFTFDEIL
jgi:NDP-sugar pyrophosphorylase family protein